MNCKVVKSKVKHLQIILEMDAMAFHTICDLFAIAVYDMKPTRLKELERLERFSHSLMSVHRIIDKMKVKK